MKAVQIAAALGLRPCDVVLLGATPPDPKGVPRLAFYDEKTKKFVVEPGAYEVMVGSSSEGIRLKGTLEVK